MTETAVYVGRPRRRVKVDCSGPSQVEQCHKDQININTIVAKAKKTGVVPMRPGAVSYGDFSNVGSFEECLNAVNEARGAFMALPAALRKRFGNNPGNLLEFLDDEDNRQEAEELGLLEIERSEAAEPPSEASGEPVEPAEPAA